MVTIVPPILGFEKPLNENGGRKPSLGLVLVCSGCSNRQENTGEPEVSEQNVSSEGERREDSETDREADTDVGESSEGAARSIPETLEQIPEGYDAPADQQGRNPEACDRSCHSGWTDAADDHYLPYLQHEPGGQFQLQSGASADG